MEKKVYVYRPTANDWVAAHDYDSAKFLLEKMGLDEDYFEGWSKQPVSEDSMRRFIMTDIDEEGEEVPGLSMWDSLQSMITEGKPFPRHIAATE